MRLYWRNLGSPHESLDVNEYRAEMCMHLEDLGYSHLAEAVSGWSNETMWNFGQDRSPATAARFLVFDEEQTKGEF